MRSLVDHPGIKALQLLKNLEQERYYQELEKMNNIQKAADVADLLSSFQLDREDSDARFIWGHIKGHITQAILDGHTGCTVNLMPKYMQTWLNQHDFQVYDEYEDDTRYWIVSWGEAIIA